MKYKPYKIFTGMNKKCLLVLVFVVAFLGTFAQKKNQAVKNPPPAPIRLLAKAYGDSIVLRWSPLSPMLWNELNNSGYAIYRIELAKGRKMTKKIMTANAIKPWPLETMRAKLGYDTMAAVAAQALYGKNFGTKPYTGGVGGMMAQKDEASMRFAFLLLAADWDAQVAEAAGLRWVDKDVKPGCLYYYEVYPFEDLKSIAIDTGKVSLINKRDKSSDRPLGFNIVSGERRVFLNWPRSAFHTCSGYFIEKSSDGGKTFVKLNHRPYLPPQADGKANEAKGPGGLDLDKYCVYQDSVEKDYKIYKYRIRGLNAFGELSAWSDTVAGWGRDLTPPAPPKLTTLKLGGTKVKLSWTKKVLEPDLAGYYVSRNHNGKKNELLTPVMLGISQSSFIDTAAYVHGVNYYFITSIDTAGNYSTSVSLGVMLPDSTPPAAPTGLTGSIDKKGHVILRWKANTEEDIKCYNVYYANSKTHVFMPRVNRGLTETVFYDTLPLKNLTHEIYYCVKAVDTHNNYSASSVLLDVTKPNIIPPQTPFITRITTGTHKVILEVMEGMPENASRYIIYRKAGSKEKDWKQIATVKQYQLNHTFSFTDAAVRSKTAYSYCVEALNGDSLHSAKCTPKQVIYYARHQEPKINTLVAKYDRSTNSVKLQWKYQAKGDYSFIIYRSDGFDMDELQSLAGSSNSYSDYHLDKKIKTYRYDIQAVFNDKREETAMGDPVKVNIK